MGSAAGMVSNTSAASNTGSFATSSVATGGVAATGNSGSPLTPPPAFPPPPPPYPPVYYPSDDPVRAEEALLVCLVLVLWVGAIILFFNRWGKIRMLEPYQPKFRQEHRPSCPMGDITCPNALSQQRTSFSKYNVSCLDTPQFACVGPSYRNALRPRQNSVFVGSTLTVRINPPRKTKSAMDLQSLVRREPSPSGLTRSMQPLSSGACSNVSGTGSQTGERRTSCATLNRARRPSNLADLLPPGAFTQQRERRPSFTNVLAQVTAERRPSSSMLRISAV